MNSPLEALYEVFGRNNFAKFLGDTLYFQIEDDRVKLKSRIWPFFILIGIGTITSSYIIYTMLTLTWLNGYSVSQMMTVAKSFNMGYTDTAGIFGFIFLNLTYMICCGLLSFKLSKHITFFSDECYDTAGKHGISMICPENGRKNWKCVLRRGVLMFCLSLTSILFLCGAMFHYQKRMFQGKHAVKCQLLRVHSNFTLQV